MGVAAQLEEFASTLEPKQLQLRDTTPADRSNAHSWVEKHASASVRGWEHVSVTIDGAKVLQVTKPDDWAPEEAAPAKKVKKTKPSKEKKAPTAAPAGPALCSGSTTVAVGGNVHDRLDEFADSAFAEMTLTGTTASDRSETHGWVEGHAKKAIQAWGHDSATVGGERVMVLTKPAGTAAPAGAGGVKNAVAKKKKGKKRKGPASTEGLTAEEIKRREWQKQKQQEAIARQQKGQPAVMSSKRRRANNPQRKGKNYGASIPDDGEARDPSMKWVNPEPPQEGDGFMRGGAWAPGA